MIQKRQTLLRLWRTPGNFTEIPIIYLAFPTCAVTVAGYWFISRSGEAAATAAAAAAGSRGSGGSCHYIPTL